MNTLYEILVPTRYGDTNKPISTRHHKKWDEFVQKITGGLTILAPAKGRWVHKGVEYPEKIIPVRVMCEENQSVLRSIDSTGERTYDFEHKQIEKIIDFTKKHYRQINVMAYVVSREVFYR